MKEVTHKPVLVNDVVKAFKLKEIAHLKKKARFIDATVGAGGHSMEIIKAGGEVLGIEADWRMMTLAEKKLKVACLALNKRVGECFKLVQGNFKDIDEIAKGQSFIGVNGVLFDLGISTVQLKSRDRGFSFSNSSAPLDMRIDSNTQSVTAADLLNSLRSDQLSELFSKVLVSGEAKKITKAVITKRKTFPFKSVDDLLKVSKGISGKKHLHPATLVFLALRMAVNSELDNLEEALPKAYDLLTSKGRLVIISFHSGEDAVVKRFFLGNKSSAKILTKKPIVPKESEIIANPSARSAKMRILEKL